MYQNKLFTLYDLMEDGNDNTIIGSCLVQPYPFIGYRYCWLLGLYAYSNPMTQTKSRKLLLYRWFTLYDLMEDRNDYQYGFMFGSTTSIYRNRYCWLLGQYAYSNPMTNTYFNFVDRGRKPWWTFTTGDSPCRFDGGPEWLPLWVHVWVNHIHLSDIVIAFYQSNDKKKSRKLSL